MKTIEKYQGNWPNWVDLTGEIIAQRAKECAWPYGTPKAKRTWPDGKPYGDFQKAIDTVFGKEYNKWSAQCRAGASCDVFASTIIRWSGYDMKVPRGLGGAGKGQYKHFAESDKFYNSKAYKPSQMKPGDYILYLNKDHGGHACIYVGNGYTAEAGYTSKRFGVIVKTSTYDPNKKKILGIYRATKPLRTYVQKGDKGEQVKRVQNFLIWAEILKDKADGTFGPKTEAAVIKWQRKNGLKEDGKFGSASLDAAKLMTKEVIRKYDGKMPTKTLKKKDSGTQVKYLQNFLDWYDDYELIRDGKFGELTEKAVKDFQKKEGLKQDGIFGPKSLAAAKKYCP